MKIEVNGWQIISWMGVLVMGLTSWFHPPTNAVVNKKKMNLNSSEAVCIKKFREVSQHIGISPEDLLTISLFETKGTLSTTIRGAKRKTPNNKGRAIGLIQFVPETLEELGTNVETVKAMTCPQQLELAKTYFKKRGFQGGGIKKAYATVFCGNPDCNKGDGYHTLNQALTRMEKEHRPKAKALLTKSAGSSFEGNGQWWNHQFTGETAVLNNTNQRNFILYQSKPLICINAEHGGRDPGAIHGGLSEQKLALTQGRLLAAMLLFNPPFRGKYNVHLSRNSNQSLSLANRRKNCAQTARNNNIPASQIITLAFNMAASGNAKGFEVWYREGNPQSSQLATSIAQAVQGTGITKLRYGDGTVPDYKNRHKRLGMLNAPGKGITPVLIETGFLTDPMVRDRQKIYQLTKAISQGIDNHEN